MYALVVLVLARVEMLQDVLQAWQDAGAPDATVIESTGLARISRLFGRDDVPLFPSLADLSEGGQSVHHTIFSVVDSDSLIDSLINATQAVVGDLSQPDRGILFVLPVVRVVGYWARHQENQQDKRTQ